tara:strand:- start:84 stop:551 length:468 start_codon:yes stop_codon:yes gene_type:complete
MILNRAKHQMLMAGELHRFEDNRQVGDLQDLFDQLNHEFFDGELPDIDCSYRDGFKRSLGRIVYSSLWTKGQKRGTRKGVEIKAIEICNKHQFTNRFLRKTMTHEMVHAWCLINHGEAGHGKRFWKKMRQVGYPKGHVWIDAESNEKDKWSDQYE